MPTSYCEIKMIYRNKLTDSGSEDFQISSISFKFISESMFSVDKNKHTYYL